MLPSAVSISPLNILLTNLSDTIQTLAAPASSFSEKTLPANGSFLSAYNLPRFTPRIATLAERLPSLTCVCPTFSDAASAYTLSSYASIYASSISSVIKSLSLGSLLLDVDEYIIPLSLIFSSLSLRVTITSILDAPMDANSLLSSAVRELPTVIMAITDAMPMMMPSIVRRALILLALRPLKASLIFSPSIIRQHLLCPLLLR